MALRRWKGATHNALCTIHATRTKARPMVQAHCVQTQARLAQAPRKRGVFLCLDFVWRSKGGTPFFIPGRNLGAKLESPDSHQNGSQKGGTPFFILEYDQDEGGVPLFLFHLEKFMSDSCGCERKGGTLFFETAPGFSMGGYPIFTNSAWVLLSRKQKKDELRSKVF